MGRRPADYDKSQAAHEQNAEHGDKPKATITWLGEDDDHEDGNGPRRNTWNGVTFEKGKPVEVDDPAMIAKAKTNKFYEVNEG